MGERCVGACVPRTRAVVCVEETGCFIQVAGVGAETLLGLCIENMFLLCADKH